ncbi:MAG: 16S rRNA (guanine(966)-N(2))-methyltransferase RsmD [Candidatus Omnitrophica bacterium]|nr:16S rRNA (guanine(966)-N(2))-methyltransferase RsmD [Candidatus Omnitrophota bacterium]
MRIVTGNCKGKTLKIPKSKYVRPTRTMVREAIFSVLGDFVEGKEVLDLFSGSGVLGFEALSNAARSVIFVEKNKLPLRVIRENMLHLGFSSECRVIGRDVFTAFNILRKKNLRFHIVFADPPYSLGLAKKCLLNIGNCDILLPSSIIVIEHYKKDELPEHTDKLKLWQLKKYGDTFVSFYVPV